MRAAGRASPPEVLDRDRLRDLRLPPAAPTITKRRAVRSAQAASAAFARPWSQASITDIDRRRGKQRRPVVLRRRTPRPCAPRSPGWMSATRSRSACDLGLADGRRDRLDLTVDVRLGDMVEVDQRQRGDAAARERLGGPRADAAERRRPRRARRGCARSRRRRTGGASRRSAARDRRPSNSAAGSMADRQRLVVVTQPRARSRQAW